MRRPEEVQVIVHRAAAGGRDVLVLRRTAERDGYWHVVAGALEEGELPLEAAVRELEEETGLRASPLDLERRYTYALAAESATPRERALYAPGVREVLSHCFEVEAPAVGSPS